MHLTHLLPPLTSQPPAAPATPLVERTQARQLRAAMGSSTQTCGLNVDFCATLSPDAFNIHTSARHRKGNRVAMLVTCLRRHATGCCARVPSGVHKSCCDGVFHNCGFESILLACAVMPVSNALPDGWLPRPLHYAAWGTTRRSTHSLQHLVGNDKAQYTQPAAPAVHWKHSHLQPV